ncbi:hypothetical protein E4T39_06216 [Aureobasidium subglaciale]|nr:hypothetical protein E4T39_06216 [Aureobasidium subglaciale]
MSANLNSTGRQERPNTSTSTPNRLPAGQVPINLAARRRKFTAPRDPFSLDMSAVHEPRVEITAQQLDEYLRKKQEFNKALPALPGKRSSSSCSSSRPRSPMDRAADWVKVKVVTPVKEFFTGLDAIEMGKGDYVSHRIDRTPPLRVMGDGTLPRTYGEHDMMEELRVDSHIPKRRSRGRPSVDREVSSRRSGSISSPNTFMSPGIPSHGSSFSSRETPQAPPTTRKSHKSHASVSSSVRSASDNVHSGLNPKAGRLVFSDQAPAGMMDPCCVCHKEPRGALYRGRCQDCR